MKYALLALTLLLSPLAMAEEISPANPPKGEFSPDQKYGGMVPMFCLVEQRICYSFPPEQAKNYLQYLEKAFSYGQGV